MLMVAPTGRTKRVTRLSIPQFSSRQRKVTGSVAALQHHHRRRQEQEEEEEGDLEAVPRAVTQAWRRPRMNLAGFRRVKRK